MADHQPDSPVTRAEFGEFRSQVTKELGDLGRHIEELFKAKQVSWPLIISVLTLAAAMLGFGIKNLADVAALSSASSSTGSAVDNFRERIRALEAAHSAGVIENETQNRWMADVANLEAQFANMLAQIKDPTIPPRTYYPLERIGGAESVPLNGRK